MIYLWRHVIIIQLQTGLSTITFVQNQHSHKFQQEKWWEAHPRHPSTIEHGDVCRSCCNQRACESLVLPWNLLALGAENVIEAQAQIALVLGRNLRKCHRSRVFKKEPHIRFCGRTRLLQPQPWQKTNELNGRRVTILVLFTSKSMCCLPYRYSRQHGIKIP